MSPKVVLGNADEQTCQNLRFEDVDSHAGQITRLQIVAGGLRQSQRIQFLIGLWFFTESDDPPFFVHLQNAEFRSLLASDGFNGDADICLALPMLFDKGPVIHAVEVVAR